VHGETTSTSAPQDEVRLTVVGDVLDETNTLMKVSANHARCERSIAVV
jgi:hypothetical protein